MNSVNIIGRLATEVEIRYTPNGKAVSNFSIAVDRTYNKDETDFFNVTIWGKSAEHCANHLGKGRLVGITGELRQERWQKEGKNYSKVKINANNVKFLDWPSDSKGGSNNNGQHIEEDIEVPF